MASIDPQSVALDPEAAATLADQGLRYDSVRSDSDGFPHYLQAMNRGFLDAESTDAQVTDSRDGMRDRRMVGVYEPLLAHPEVPVATVESWVADLTVEPGRTIPMWAISGVTVAPTHRRRGIAKAMLEGELRAAAKAGLALAGLTVSETTIYGRWGFAPAVFTTNWTIQTRRARWIGPIPAGRLEFVPRDELPDALAALHERVRLQRAGEVNGWPHLWRWTAGLHPDADGQRKIRAVRHTDPDGTVRGLVVFTLVASPDDFTDHRLEIKLLLADGTDAYAALWRFALEHDLVTTVTATLCASDEPLRWMIADQRAAKVTHTDHEWLRVLDVPAALRARRFSTEDTLVLKINDPLGFAEGTWRLTATEDGAVQVEATDEPAQVTLSVNALGSLLLGGVAAATLRAAGLITADDASLRTLHALFTAERPPHLSLWY
ncbi:MAG TPA: GNAT family N-acetyltransferase [Micropruina sp.]|nr:GNAT family N-acetyltransferase [Micropruina sp.]